MIFAGASLLGIWGTILGYLDKRDEKRQQSQ